MLFRSYDVFTQTGLVSSRPPSYDVGVRSVESYRTYTDGDGWKSNGRVESEIAVRKRGIKTLLDSAGLDVKFWPLAARHYMQSDDGGCSFKLCDTRWNR